MSMRHDTSTDSKAFYGFKTNEKINKSKTSDSTQNKQSSDDSTGTNASEYQHDMGELLLLKDQLYACYTGILAYLLLISATHKSIDQIEFKYNGGDVDSLPNPSIDANLSSIVNFFTILQFTRIAYVRFIQVTQEYAEGVSDIPPIYRQQILYGLIISVANMLDQRFRELRSPYSPVLTPFPG